MGLRENKVSTKQKKLSVGQTNIPKGKSLPDIFHTESEYPGFTNDCRN